jgi:hypothetical protein
MIKQIIEILNIQNRCKTSQKKINAQLNNDYRITVVHWQKQLHLHASKPCLFCVQAKTADAVTADYNEQRTNWGDNDPSVFQMNFIGNKLTGEFQLTNGYGSNASSVLSVSLSVVIRLLLHISFGFVDVILLFRHFLVKT